MMESTSPARSPLRSRALLVGMVLMFAAPLLIAVLFYAFSEQLPIPAAESHGKLIVPPHPFERFDLTRPDGKPLNIEYLRGRWTLVYVGDGRCDLWCQAALFKMRQVRLSLGRDQARVQRIYLLAGAQEPREWRALMRRNPGMTIAMPREGTSGTILRALSPRPSGTFFLIDPLANLMMRYPPSTTSEGLKEDLSQLLKVSTIG
jgi:hypothetical protein